MKTSILIRFGIAAILTTAGCALILTGTDQGILLFNLAIIFFMPRSELRRAIPLRELWGMFGVLLAISLVVYVVGHVLPGSAAAMVHRVVCHPAFVVPLWLWMMRGLFGHYQKQKREISPDRAPKPLV